MQPPNLWTPGGAEIARGLVAFSLRGRAIIQPTDDGAANLPEWANVSEAEQSAIIKATAAANADDWHGAYITLEAAGFLAGIR